MKKHQGVRAHSHCKFFFLNVTAIPLVTSNGLYRTQWKCSHYAIAKTLSTPTQPNMSKNKSQLQIAQCERALTGDFVDKSQSTSRYIFSELNFSI